MARAPGPSARRRLGALGVVALVLAGTACDPAELARRQAFVGEVVRVDAARLGSSWRPGCPVRPADLRLVRVSFWGFDDRGHQGEIVVHRRVATKVVGVFRRLWDERFPLWRVETPERFVAPGAIGRDHRFGGADLPHDAANVTTGFFCRRVLGGRSWSQHAYGTAIDVNPVQNPFVVGATTSPAGARWDPAAPGTVTAEGVVVAAFRDAGFVWGGTWRSSKDYMHFSTSGR